MNFIEKEIQKLSKNDKYKDKSKIESLINSINSQIVPISSEKYIELEKNNKIVLDEEDGLLILPDKCFVIQTFNSISNKIFIINILSHPAVEEPHEVDLIDDEVKLLEKRNKNSYFTGKT